MQHYLTTEKLLVAYASGVFPMADPDEEDRIYWFAPDPRAILPLDSLVISRSLRRVVSSNRFEVTTDRNFEEVIRACADREETWISPEISRAYVELHCLGYAHSVECRLDEELVGGLYGVALRGGFFGESMFHRVTDASKVALVHLVNRLNRAGYSLLDVQFMSDHLRTLGAVEVSRDEYEGLLDMALQINPTWN